MQILLSQNNAICPRLARACLKPKMASKWVKMNFLGLVINKKVVDNDYYYCNGLRAWLNVSDFRPNFPNFLDFYDFHDFFNFLDQLPRLYM